MTAHPHLLFVTNRDDYATDYLIYQMQNRDIPYLRINSEDIVNLSISFRPKGSIIVAIKDVLYELNEVKTVYFRRAPTVFPNALHVADTSFLNRERKEFFEGIYLGLQARWINPIYSTYIAERKLYQLKIASQLGFRIPRTIVTNNPNHLTAFAEELSKNVVIKPISHGLQVSEDGTFSIYTSEIRNFDFCSDQRLFEAPVLVQEKVDNHCDLRVTVIDNNFFAVEVIKRNSSEVDWRKPTIEKTYKIHKLPDRIKAQIERLHRKLNLVYSAIDFILTPKNEYVFLETNPAGEWVWLEKELGLPISETLLNALVRNNESKQNGLAG